VRILMVTPFFSPQMGGAAQAVFHTAQNLGLRGHDITVLTGDHAQRSATFTPGPFQSVSVPSRLNAFGMYVTPMMRTWAEKNIARFQIVHFHITRTYQNVLLKPLALRHRIPYVITAHGTLPRIDRMRTAKWAYDLFFGRNLYRDAAGWVAVTSLEAEQFREAGILPERIRVIGNGLDITEFDDLPDPGAFRKTVLGSNADARLLLAMSRLHRIKGLDFLLEGFSRLPSTGAEFHLAVVGPDEGELSRLQALARKLGVDRSVHFPGPVYGRQRLQAFVDADLFLSTSRYEITGLTSFEALMCGVPVIVTRECGQGRLIEEAGAGYLVPFGDAEGLAATIRRVMADRGDAKRRVRAGRSYVRRNMDWRKKTEELIRLYEDILESPTGESRL
jgi:glycosyltransferase involved in cell wall biosynthesis